MEQYKMMRDRAILVVLVVVSTMWLAGCGHYTCGTTFGNASCSQSGSGFSTGTGTGTSTGAFVYAVDEAGTIDGYSLDTTAVTFGPITSYTAPTVPTNQGGVGMTVAQKQFLYAGFGTVNQIYGYTISSAGALTAISGSPFVAPGIGGYVGGVGQDNMITNPAGTLLFYPDAAANLIYVFQIGTGGVLTEVGNGYACPPGFIPMNMTTDGLGKYLYVVNGTDSNHQGSAIAAFSIGTGTSLGVLTPVTGSPFPFNMWQVRGDSSGNYLIGTTGTTAIYAGTDDKNLYVFSIGSTGAITKVATQVTQFAPFSIAVQPNSGGTFVYSFGFTDDASAFNPIEGFSIGSGGALTAATGEPFSIGEGSWGQFDQSGALLFSYASFLDVSTNTVVTQLSPLSVGTGGALTEPTSNATFATPGFWVVTDVQ